MIEQVKYKIDNKTKPLGALGRLEDIATQVCLAQQTLIPTLEHPTMLVFAADHGIASSGVSAYPSEVTAQMVANFLQGGAAINVLCKQHGIDLKIVDAGVNQEVEKHKNLIDAKVGKGTNSFLAGNAMSEAALETCFDKAETIIESVHLEGCNVVGFGEMGIGNTSSASLLMSVLCNIPIEQCVGRGTGLNDEQLAHKLSVLNQALENHPTPGNARQALVQFGGFEIAQVCAGMLAAFKKNMLILVDGFIATAAYLCACTINPAIKGNALFCHQSDEQGHKLMLEFLDASPILNLGMRLGEGTGCAVAYPIIESAVRFVNEMASFEHAGVSQQT
ncbi:MAG: nicotinate-nucleotide--dimethylbenzimidazole phosphoribosyltransferase [Bacteroidota bacterium]